MQNLHLTFVLCSASQKQGEDFAKYCGLLRIYELYECTMLQKLTFNMVCQLTLFIESLCTLITSKIDFLIVNDLYVLFKIVFTRTFVTTLWTMEQITFFGMH